MEKIMSRLDWIELLEILFRNRWGFDACTN
jgi:hypothetical protein